MRAPVLNPLFASITSLPGVGPKLAVLYGKLLGRDEPRVIDLMLHMPSGTIDRRARPRLNEVQPGRSSRVCHRRRAPAGAANRPRAPYRIVTSDDTGTLTLTFFHARRDHLEKLLPVGEKRYVSGTAEFYDGMLQMVHPDRVVDEKGFADLPLVEPVYPLTEGSISQCPPCHGRALARVPALPEWQDEAWVSRERLPPFAEALRSLHKPQEPSEYRPRKPGLDAACLRRTARRSTGASVDAHTYAPAGRPWARRARACCARKS